MRAAGYGDRVYGRAVTTVGGKTWLQYWLFSYYNPQNVLGFGVHEGDWEFVQVGLNADGAPDVATYAQHDGGERCAWSSVQRTTGGAPVVYVALASHASYFSSGVNPRGFYPDDYHRGGGYQVRPALEIVTQTDAVHGLARQVGRVVLEPDRAAPAGQVGRSQRLRRRRQRLHRRRHAALGDGAREATRAPTSRRRDSPRPGTARAPCCATASRASARGA